MAEIGGEGRRRYDLWARAAEEHSESRFSRLIVSAYQFSLLRGFCLSLAGRLEGGEMHSVTQRRLLSRYHGVTVGRYSYGACLTPGILPRATSVGSYCSTAEGLRVFRRNHPSGTLSQHPFFYNKELGLVVDDTIHRIEDNPLVIGSDVWIGSGVTILPGCKFVGDGAIVGAGSIVTRDIAPFTVNAGSPARAIRERFSPQIRVLVEQSQWWKLSIAELGEASDLLTGAVTSEGLGNWMLRSRNSVGRSLD